MIEETTLMTKVGNRWMEYPVTLSYEKGRIYFLQSDRALKNEIKAMTGAKWHGYDDPSTMYWSVSDTPRNRFQLNFMKGENVYEHFDQSVVERTYSRPLFAHQRAMADHFLTYHYGVMAAEMGTGKTLALQEIMETATRERLAKGLSKPKWLWIGPKSSLVNVKRELNRWQLAEYVDLEMMSYEAFTKWVSNFNPNEQEIPFGLLCDEASKLKSHTVKCSQAAQTLADMIRAKYGMEGFVILASGTPSPKTPTDWWSLCEIAFPGFLKEGSVKALQQRLAIMVQREFNNNVINQIVAWRDDEARCEVCGEFEDAPQHPHDHKYQPCGFNEVEYLHKRLQGLVIVFLKKDVLKELPEKQYREVYCTPDPSILRAAKVIANTATNAMTGHTLLRELSDGFQYRDKVVGTTKCTACPDACGVVEEWFHPESESSFSQIDLFDEGYAAQLIKRSVPCPACSGTGEMPKIVRETIELPCAKDQALRDLIDENDEVGRLVVFAGFTGSVDRIAKIFKAKKWSVVCCDGRGLRVIDSDGKIVPKINGLEYWSDLASNPKVAFVSHPESGGMSFTLTEARMAIFWSNTFKSQYRPQAEDRIHRPGMDLNKACWIVDLLHLPSDKQALDTVRDDRRLELMTLGAQLNELKECYATAA